MWLAASCLSWADLRVFMERLWSWPQESLWATGMEPEVVLPSPEGPEEVVVGLDLAEHAGL